MRLIRPIVFLVLVGLIGPVLRADQPSGPTEASVRQAMERVFPALVRIFVVMQEPDGGRMQRMQGAGSGFIISPEGYVVTNHHVAGNATRIVVNLANHDEIEASLAGTDPLTDISVLKLKLDSRKDPSEPLPVAAWGDSDALRVGDVVLAMGSPGALSQSVTQGIVSNTSLIMPKFMHMSLQMDGEDVGSIVRWIAHDAVIFGGNSGGPLVNLKGEVVGINEIGVASLGGAIPSILARDVVGQLIKTGDVARSWTGLELQPRLKGDARPHGVLVGGVLPESPAREAGLQAGDLLLHYDGADMDAAVDEDLPPINQRIFSTPIGKTVSIEYLRGQETRTAHLTTTRRFRPQARPTELKSWGITARDITPLVAREKHRADTRGVVIDSLRPGGGAAEAKPALAEGDIVTEVGGKEVANAEALAHLTDDALEDKTERVPLLVHFDRGEEHLLTVVRVGKDEPEQKPALAHKAWPAMATQVLTPDVAQALGLAGQKGVRVIEVYPGQAAEKADLKVGDIITTFGGMKIEASQPEESELFPSLVRKFRVGQAAEVAVLRDGKPLRLNMTLTAAPSGADTSKRFESTDFEFVARDMTFDDRSRLKTDESTAGVVVEKVERAGWASLGGIAVDDVILGVDGLPTVNVDRLKAILEASRKTKSRRLAFFIRRGIHTLYCEIEPDWK